MSDETTIKRWMENRLLNDIGDIHERTTAEDHLADRACEQFGQHSNLRELAAEVAGKYL